MELPPFRLERYFAASLPRTRHLLCASDCEPFTLGELQTLAGRRLEAEADFSLAYPDNAGLPELRAAIAALERGLTADDIVIFTGASEAIFTLMNIAISAGDHIVVQTPAYPSLYKVAEAIGCRVTAWPARLGTAAPFDLDHLVTLLQARPRLLVLNLPHNPTGQTMSPEALARVVELCRQAGTRLVCDEVYRRLEFAPDTPTLPTVAALDEQAISIGDLSKAYALAGLRIGWIATRDAALRARLLAFKDYTTIMAAGPSQLLATWALRAADQIIARNRRLLKGNARLLARAARAAGGRVDVWPPRAGTTALVRLPSGAAPASALAQALLDEAGVLVLPGPMLDLDDAWIRIGIGRRAMATGLRAASRWAGQPESAHERTQ